jgi:hypothetical protein
MSEKSRLPEGLIGVEDEQPKIVTKDDPLVITSTTATFPWVQIQPGGEVRVQIASTVQLDKLEKTTASSRGKR